MQEQAPPSPRTRNRPATHMLPLALIFALGAFLRFFDLGTVRHGYDEGYPAYLALRLLDAGEWLLVGQPSSVFLDNPPLIAYIQAIPLLLWRSPWSVYIFVTALNTLAIPLVYWLTADLWGRRPALVAAFLFATNPWIIYFSQLPWHQGLLPFFTALIAWGLWPTLAGKPAAMQRLSTSGRFLIGLLAVTALALTYVQALGILAQLIPLLLLFHRRLPRRTLLVGAAVFLVGMTLYGYGLAQNWSSSQANLQDLSEGNTFRLTLEGANHAIRLVTGQEFVLSFVEQGAAPGWLPQLIRLAHWLLLALLLMGTGRTLLSLRHPRPERRIATILLLWFAIPVLLTIFSPFLVHPHYLLLTIPAGHLLATWGMEPFLRHRPARLALAVAGVALALLSWTALGRTGAANAASPAGPDFNGWTLTTAHQLGARIRELAAGPVPQQVAASGEEALLSSLSGRHLEVQRDLDPAGFVLLPAENPLLYVLVNRPGHLAGVPAEFQETFPSQELVLTDGTTASFLRTRPVSREEALTIPQQVLDWPSDAGLSLLGYTLVPAGRDLTVTTYWRVDTLHPAAGEWFVASFYHLRDQGQILVNTNEHGRWGHDWQPGDIYVETITLTAPPELPAGNYELAISLYDPVHNSGFALHSPDGPVPAVVLPVQIGEGP